MNENWPNERVCFRSDSKYNNLFKLNEWVNLEDIKEIPKVGDVITAYRRHFDRISYRVSQNSKFIMIRFRVVSREYNISHRQWLLTCEPEPEELAQLLKTIKTK